MSAEFNHPSAATRPSRSPLTWHTFWWRYGVLLASLLLTLPSCSSSNKAEQVEQTRAAVATIAFVQVNSTDPQSPQASLVLPYNSAQGAGNLNVVIVGWNDTISSISSVTDTRGNVYQLAVGPTVRAGFATQAIYYAKNIAAGSNSVNVVFDRAADYVDLRILEYTGIDPTTALDVTASATGSSATANSGAVTTTNANDLIVGANMVSTWTSAPGTGFSPRVVTNPDGDIAEDRIVSAVGSYSATATLGSPGDWIMQLAAFRAAGSPADTQAPTAPANLVATAASATQINLTWSAATDNVGVTSYLIERCAGAGCSNFAQVATSASTSFSNTGLTASTSYSYRVRASDAATNLSSYSNTSNATTSAAPDTQAPSAPANLSASSVSVSQINLTWSAATDNVAVTNYLIERCAGAGCSNFAQIATSTSTSFSNTGLTASTSYSYRVRATDAANNLGSYSNAASATTATPPDTQAPSAPTSLAASSVSVSQINLTWTAATDNVGVTSYLIERCAGVSCSNFAQIATATSTSFSNTGLSASTSYSYRVRASDAANNLGGYSNTASATTATPPDTQAPSAPSNLLANVSSISQIDLTWTAATDNVGVTGYLIERCVGI
ncbi:MAG TPA: fibronectin type III domain-containing protein, partial [Polyangiaceae bacterium]|nr:fibronectin type III domain-containing protein [Polyangiaceae bacterium]